jgi:hypothetical protein
MPTIAEDVKKLLNGSNDERLEIIERRTTDRLKSMLGISTNIPTTFDFIVYEVTMKRFNRIGNEGMQSYSQEGLSMTFPDSDFSEYQAEIEDWKNQNDANQKRGRFRLY